jgi:tRNA-specific 2-thiouridylase
MIFMVLLFDLVPPWSTVLVERKGVKCYFMAMNRKNKTVAVGLSGGVDSSAAVILLKEQGYDVYGIHMKLVEDDGVNDAQRVAEHLEIPFYDIDMIDLYRERIVEYIRTDYAMGRTPNPCVRCNRELKFGLFWERAREIAGDFDYFATGHYAHVEQNESGRYLLRKGLHGDKDQAYFLSLLSQDQLSKILFPLGDLEKPFVREIAARWGLFTAQKKESQDLCVGEYRNFLHEGAGPGDFVDSSGKILGQHKGIEQYTVGQRRGLNIAAGYPVYVTAIDRANNRVVVGPDEDLMTRELIIDSVNWGSVENPPLPYRSLGKIRYRDKGAPCVIEKKEGEKFHVRFDEPKRAVTPGQLAVFYNEDGFVELAGYID